MNSPAATYKLTSLVGAFALLAGACTSGVATTSATTTSSTTSSTSTSTSTTAAPPPSTTGVPKPSTLGPGAAGAAVSAMQQRLHDTGYDIGVDGKWGSTTTFALIAFQKVEGLGRSGRLDTATAEKLATATKPGAMMAGGPNRVEVDLKRQVLFLWKDGNLARILPVSTGNTKRYCVDGQCATAVTPGGSFRVSRKIDGLRISRLGKLYNPLYFNGGIAFHGAPSVPAYPASHGCVRIPMYASASFFRSVPIGTAVYVLGGKTAPVPFNEKAPGEETSTTTTAPTTTTSSTPTTTSTTSSTTTSTL